MYKRIIYISFFTAILFANRLSSQIVYTVEVTPISCNYSELGRIRINVTSTHPPYSFIWSPTGDTSNVEDNLLAGTYSLTISDANGNDTMVNIVMLEPPCKLKGDPIFSPNGDGKYDTWKIENAEHFPEIRILIYNRLGQKVFEHKDGIYNEEWDGRDRMGVPVPDGAYYFIIYKDKSDKTSIIKGCVSIIR